MVKRNGFDVKAWIQEQKSRKKPLKCSICKNPLAAADLRIIAEAWANGAQGINLKKICEEVLIEGHHFSAPTAQTVQRHLLRCEPELWKKILVVRQSQ